jgi:hypothetical protein
MKLDPLHEALVILGGLQKLMDARRLSNPGTVTSVQCEDYLKDIDQITKLIRQHECATVGAESEPMRKVTIHDN